VVMRTVCWACVVVCGLCGCARVDDWKLVGMQAVLTLVGFWGVGVSRSIAWPLVCMFQLGHAVGRWLLLHAKPLLTGSPLLL
jgi:hypothetical protein